MEKFSIPVSKLLVSISASPAYYKETMDFAASRNQNIYYNSKIEAK